MNTTENFVERRKHKRFQPKEGTFVATAGNLGQILDISMAGLSFSFVNWDDQTDNSGELDIIFDGNDLLNRLPYKTISETIIENKFPSSPILMKRCGLKFGELNAEQKTLLEVFIKQHTINEA